MALGIALPLSAHMLLLELLLTRAAAAAAAPAAEEGYAGDSTPAAAQTEAATAAEAPAEAAGEAITAQVSYGNLSEAEYLRMAERVAVSWVYRLLFPSRLSAGFASTSANCTLFAPFAVAEMTSQVCMREDAAAFNGRPLPPRAFLLLAWLSLLQHKSAPAC